MPEVLLEVSQRLHSAEAASTQFGCQSANVLDAAARLKDIIVKIKVATVLATMPG
jgi:hypothetical protein